MKGLEEQFVYFNDDMFTLKNMQPKDRQGLVCHK